MFVRFNAPTAFLSHYLSSALPRDSLPLHIILDMHALGIPTDPLSELLDEAPWEHMRLTLKSLQMTHCLRHVEIHLGHVQLYPNESDYNFRKNEIEEAKHRVKNELKELRATGMLTVMAHTWKLEE